MKKAFYIKDFNVEGVGYNALNKSRLDLHRIYDELGFEALREKEITVEDEKFKNMRKNSARLSGYVSDIIAQIDMKCHPGDYLFMDFPFAIKFMGLSKIATYASTKNVKVVFFIHDLDGVRFQNPLLNLMDSSCLDLAHALISATPSMDKTLQEELKVSTRPKIVNYRYWDYLCPDVPNEKRNFLLCFAGNLSKSSFLSEIPDPLFRRGVSLYGKGMKTTYKGLFMGEYDPIRIVSEVDGLFGLVWDGKSAKTCSGNFGKYLRINTSHKFALYMAARKPVIVWSESPLASIVKERGIGFDVSSLEQIAFRISELSFQGYLAMKRNVEEMRKDIISGRHLKDVILSAMK